MSCSTCGTGHGGKSPGCRSNGGCATGGCNKLNTYDWISAMDLEDPTDAGIVEVSFRNGASKQFYKLQNFSQAETGDAVVVDADGGYDVGVVSLRGPLVYMQMKRKSVKTDGFFRPILRKASSHEIDKLEQANGNNKNTLVQARAIARSLGLDMKIGDVEYRADLKKATFFYTADSRVDFRELIRHYAREFKVKIEMRQIGSRQESSRIGGLGSCGRELCCSTWLTDFKSVTTNAARYQNLAINQAKLSGQCGRLKCCLNYELDVYVEALASFPEKAENIPLKNGYAKLIKTDIFKRLMYYIRKDEKGREAFITLTVDEVIEIKQRIAKGDIPETIMSTKAEIIEDISAMKSEDLVGHIVLPDERRKKKKKRNRNQDNKSENSQNNQLGNQRNQSQNLPQNNKSVKQNQNSQPKKFDKSGLDQPSSNQPRNQSSQNRPNDQSRNNQRNNNAKDRNSFRQNTNPTSGQQKSENQKRGNHNHPKRHFNQDKKGGSVNPQDDNKKTE